MNLGESPRTPSWDGSCTQKIASKAKFLQRTWCGEDGKVGYAEKYLFMAIAQDRFFPESREGTGGFAGSVGDGVASLGEGGASIGRSSSGSCTHISQQSRFAGKAKVSASRVPPSGSIRDAGAIAGGELPGSSAGRGGQESRIPHSSQTGIREIISSREGSNLKSRT